MKKFIYGVLMAAIVIFAGSTNSQAQSLLVSDSGGIAGYGYGYPGWDNMTAALDTAFGGSANIDVVSDFEDYSQMLGYDALWLDQRWKTGSLSGSEISNIASFIGTGRRVVMIGENGNWTSWNNQILGIVGGSFAGNGTGNTSSIVAHELTAGVSTVSLSVDGRAFGGSALFDQNFATLWGDNDNVLTLLSVTLMRDGNWVNQDNAQFATNVANWAAAPVPEPASMLLLGSGLLGLGLFRRKRNIG